MIARQIIFEGRVQGVGFRYTCRELAKGFDLVGFAKNLPDGTVQLVLQGDSDEIEEYLDEIVDESALSHHIKGHLVTSLEVDPELSGFQIAK